MSDSETSVIDLKQSRKKSIPLLFQTFSKNKENIKEKENTQEIIKPKKPIKIEKSKKSDPDKIKKLSKKLKKLTMNAREQNDILTKIFKTQKKSKYFFKSIFDIGTDKISEKKSPYKR